MTAPATTRRTRKTRPHTTRRNRTWRLPRLGWGWAIAALILYAVARTWPLYTALTVGLIALTVILAVVRPRPLAPLIDRAARVANRVAAHRSHLPAPGHRTLQHFLSLHHTHFEHAITALAHEDQRIAHAQHTGQTADRGADSLITLHNGYRILIQCKHHTTSKKVGSNTVREIAGSVLANRCHAGVIVTTTGFTTEAHATNRDLGRNALTLIDGQDLVAWANGGHAPW